MREHNGLLSSFQSHFGLILTPRKRMLSGNERKFQSHFGLILTIPHCAARVAGLISIPFWSDFNLVENTRKHIQSLISIPFWSDFNPQQQDELQVACRFQSHFGLILTFSVFITIIHLVAISIPFWSDFNHAVLKRAKEGDISIPFWSDFNQRAFNEKYKPRNLFQSHFGLILTAELVQDNLPSPRFQSHFGLILTQPRVREWCEGGLISIPFWSDFNQTLPEGLVEDGYFNPILV